MSYRWRVTHGLLKSAPEQFGAKLQLPPAASAVCVAREPIQRSCTSEPILTHTSIDALASSPIVVYSHLRTLTRPQVMEGNKSTLTVGEPAELPRGTPVNTWPHGISYTSISRRSRTARPEPLRATHGPCYQPNRTPGDRFQARCVFLLCIHRLTTLHTSRSAEEDVPHVAGRDPVERVLTLLCRAASTVGPTPA